MVRWDSHRQIYLSRREASDRSEERLDILVVLVVNCLGGGSYSPSIVYLDRGEKECLVSFAASVVVGC